MGHLALFDAVGREGNVTRAADREAISQPAVSKSIAELERSLDVRLFDRGPKGVTLTEAGEILFGYSSQIFGLERQAREALNDLQGLRTGAIHIGASTTIGDHILPAAIASFVSKYPRVEVNLEIGNTEMVQNGVEQGRYDIGFTEGEADSERFAIRQFAEDELIVVAPTNGRWNSTERWSLTDLQSEPFVMREPGSGTRYVVERAFRERGFMPHISASLGSATAIQRAVRAGLGLAILSKWVVSEELSAGKLVQLNVDLNITRPLHIVRLKWRRESVAVTALIKEVLG